MFEPDKSTNQPTNGGLPSQAENTGLVDGGSHPVAPFTDDHLIKACANFKELIENPEALLNNAGNFVRAMYVSVTDVQAVLDKTQGNYVKLYYGVMDSVNGEHFMFMAPCEATGNETRMPATASLLGGINLVAATSRAITPTVAVPECIGKTPPCPQILDRFVQ